ncbi:MAG: ATP-binding protein [Cyanobacteria bacterium P01_G01_bin.54]
MKFVTQEQPNQRYELCLDSRIQEVDRVIDFVAGCLPKTVLWNCQTAMVEGFVNAVKHAHKGFPPTTPIRLEVLLFAQWVECRVWDQGQPFDWAGALKAKLANPPGPNDTSGRGMIWIYKLTDHVEYVRVDDRYNCLKMYKQLS